MNSQVTGRTRTTVEPKPGEWIPAEQFAEVICLTPLVAIDLVVRTPDQRMLVGRRIHEPAKGFLFVPGSRISKNETLAIAFKRITKEELGLEVSIDQARFLGVYEHFYRTNRFQLDGFGTHYIVLAYELQRALDTTKLPTDQHGEYLWLTAQQATQSAQVHENTKAYCRPT